MHQRLLIAAAFLLSAAPAYAAHKLHMPYVEEGEWELEYFGSRSNDGDPTIDNTQLHEISVGYGVNSWWRTEVEAHLEKAPQDQTRFDAWEWENSFQFTERGEYWLDAGVVLAYEHTPQSNRANAVEGILVLAKDIGRTTHVLNATLEKEVGSGPKGSVEGELLWSSRYTVTPYFEPGFEISSGFGELSHPGRFADQDHSIGPVIYGSLPVHMAGKADGLKYRIGYMFGISDAAASGDALAQLEYEIHF